MTHLSDTQLRLLFFACFFIAIACWEFTSPKRALSVAKKVRWFNNIGLIFIGSYLVQFLLPLTAIGLAGVAEDNGWGLFNSLELPFWVNCILSFLLLDLCIYLQHLVFHYVPTLWRLHKVHHTDLDFDLSTGVRFHPLEIFLSMIIKMAAVACLGPPILAVVVFEITLNATSLFNHGNINLPARLDGFLRLIIVTPDMHRVHHSVVVRETNSNFGFNLPWWDRMFGTYHTQPDAGHLGMTIGLSQFRKVEQVTLIKLLFMPFVRKREG